MGSSANLVRQLVEEKENSEFKPVKLRLKIDFVSKSARAEGLVNMDKYYNQWTTHPTHLTFGPLWRFRSI